MITIAIFVSGSGSNMVEIINATKHGILKNLARVTLVISNNQSARAIAKAQAYNIKTICIKRSEFNNENDFNKKILKLLVKEQIDIICLAGYLKMLGINIINTYKNKILNIHPSLLPKFGGKGMYGIHVHRAVYESKESFSGATVHFVDENYDTGQIILQKSVSINRNELPKDIAKKVLIVEHTIYPQAIKHVITNYFKIPGGV